MARSKHTPGPWTSRKGRILKEAGELSFCVADVKSVPLTYSKIGGEYEANAKLIAASPELLEALKLAEEMSVIFSWVSHLGNIPERRDEYLAEAIKADELNDEAVDLRRQAIAKAEGE